MPNPPADWERASVYLRADGSLRDLYVRGADAALWNKFLGALLAAGWKLDMRHGEQMTPVPIRRFEEAEELTRTQPLLLRIHLRPALTLNCHFFWAEDIELDVDPRELVDERAFDSLMGFMHWLADVVARPVLLTHENEPESVIVRVEPMTPPFKSKKDGPDH